MRAMVDGFWRRQPIWRADVPLAAQPSPRVIPEPPMHFPRLQAHPARVTCMRSALRSWRLPLAFIAALIVLQAAGLRECMEYQRASILRGELWRLLGNLVHLGWAHLTRDIIGLGLIWWLFEARFEERTWLWVLAASSLVVGGGLLAFNPGISWYVGVSGALFGLFTAGALCAARTHPLYGGSLLLGMTAVIAWSLHSGALPAETAGLGGTVVPQAHLYGAIGGAVSVSACRGLRGQAAVAG